MDASTHKRYGKGNLLVKNHPNIKEYGIMLKVGTFYQMSENNQKNPMV
jgi:hypothetical protein